MELVVRKNDLLRELQLFQGIVERKNTIPILANVLMEAKGDEVRFLATDLEVALRSRCQAAVAKGGSLTLPAQATRARGKTIQRRLKALQLAEAEAALRTRRGWPARARNVSQRGGACPQVPRAAGA